MANIRFIDYAAVKVFCQRCGIESGRSDERRGDKYWRLDMLLNCLSKDVEELGALAKANDVTLYQLACKGLLPPELACRVRDLAPKSGGDRSNKNSYFHKPVASINEDECTAFGACEKVGKVAMGYVRALVAVCREAGGFHTLITGTGAALSEADQTVLLNRIAAAVRSNVSIQRKLLGMFPV